MRATAWVLAAVLAAAVAACNPHPYGSSRYDYVESGQAPNTWWYWQPQPRLQLSTQSGPLAVLQDAREFTDFELHDLTGDGGRLFLEIDRSWTWYQTVLVFSNMNIRHAPTEIRRGR